MTQTPGARRQGWENQKKKNNNNFSFSKWLVKVTPQFGPSLSELERTRLNQDGSLLRSVRQTPVLIPVVMFCSLLCRPGDARMLKDVGRALVLHRQTVMPYATYSRRRRASNDEAEVQQYGGLVGQQCAERILLYRA